MFLDAIRDKCKIIFPSTHVVFEGIKETKNDIHEEEKPCPISYAILQAKVKNEITIKKFKEKLCNS